MDAADFLNEVAKAIVRVKAAETAGKAPDPSDRALFAEAEARTGGLPPEAMAKAKLFLAQRINVIYDERNAAIERTRHEASENFAKEYVEKRSTGIMGKNSLSSVAEVKSIARGDPQTVEITERVPGTTERKVIGTEQRKPNDADQRRAAILEATMTQDGERIIRGPTMRDPLTDLDPTPRAIAEESIAGDVARAFAYHAANPTTEEV